jgi:multiple sugar transport system permease protein
MKVHVSWAQAVRVALLLLAVGYLAGPFVWLVGASFMTEKEQQEVRWFPRRPVLANYRAYLAPDPRDADIGFATARSFGPAMVNTLVIAVTVTLLNLTLGALAAYALARLPTRANLSLLLFYLVSRSVPAVAIMIPMYLLMQRLGLLDHVLAVILAHCTFTLPFTIWLLKSYFQTVPVDLERAARVDGCGRLKALLRVFLPVTAPGLVAAGIFAFIFSWGEFLYALLFTTTMRSKPLTVIASEFIAEIDIPFPLIAAGGVIAVLVPVALAFLFQRFIVRGIGGAVTG